jgi:hypothetical protein
MGSADIVLLEHIQHAGARHAGDDSHGDGCQGNRRQNNVLAASTNAYKVARDQGINQEQMGDLLDSISVVIRPAVGNQSSITPNKMISISPSQKMGMETPMSEPSIVELSIMSRAAQRKLSPPARR